MHGLKMLLLRNWRHIMLQSRIVTLIGIVLLVCGLGITNVGQVWILVDLLFELLKLHLLNVLPNLLCQQASQLITDVVLRSKGCCQHLWVITFMDEYVIVLTFAYFNGERQYFLLLVIRLIVLLDRRCAHISTFIIEVSRHQTAWTLFIVPVQLLLADCRILRQIVEVLNVFKVPW